MTPHVRDPRTGSDLLDSMEQVLDETTDGQSRRALMARAGGLLAAGATLTIPGVASAATGASGSSKDIRSVLATFEAFGVTLLTEAAKRAPGTPSAQFAGVLKAANITEFFHLSALRRIGGKPLTEKFWIPNAVLDGNVGLFNAIANQEEVEISAYLVGVTEATKRRDAKQARLYAEALGTEAEHRVLARFARATLTNSIDVPNNRAFEAFHVQSATSALKASASLGIGFGTKSPAPGAFYDYPGDPRKTGTAVGITTTKPA